MVLFGKRAYCGRYVGYEGILVVFPWAMAVRGWGGLSALSASACLSTCLSLLPSFGLGLGLIWLGLMDLCLNLIDLGMT